MLHILLILQQIDIEDKLDQAPDGNYQIGVIIGTFLPFLVLAGLAYWAFFKAKNRQDLDD
ncbi:MAG: hypothetical protein COB60_02810 [Flavobacteriaceae bacterium]|nr:MAG: hypothetical protein COB60_02810 [Flavobacteriaceae bacterium]